MKKYRLPALILAIMVISAGCSGQISDSASETDTPQAEESSGQTDEMTEADMNNTVTDAVLPEALAEIPEEYNSESEYPGTLVELEYDTYESMTYEEQETVLHKRAIVYLPYGYSEDTQYNVFYLMHGGWSDETTYLGTPEHPNVFKNILDNGIAEGKILPMIVVCPTYNNESDTDSSDYSLALELTDNYHNELINDLIPAVESTYSTYAADTTPDGLRESRDHRAFCGFSMGSVTTWRTFQYCLDYFRYFMPSSGSLTTDGDYMASIVRDSGHDWDDFFIFAASGTDDFAYSSFKAYLRKRGVSYILAGRDSLDCRLAAEKLYKLFHIKKLLICGGGVVNWSFLQAGVIDELSLLLAPVTDGSRGSASLFTQLSSLNEGSPVEFTLKTVEKAGDNGVYLNYLAENAENGQ